MWHIHISDCLEVSRLEVVVLVVVEEEEELWSAQYLCTLESLSLVDALLSAVECFFTLAILFSCCLCRRKENNVEREREIWFWFDLAIVVCFLFCCVNFVQNVFFLFVKLKQQNETKNVELFLYLLWIEKINDCQNQKEHKIKSVV